MRRRTMMLSSMAAGLPAPAMAATPVVLELFTSQGCSSCPPADALLGELSRAPEVMALAWHVDYWNNLGWRDPYASRQWSDRQRGYARHLHAEVYTPALVINGATMVVGSDRRAVRDAIERAPSLPVATSLRRDGTTIVATITASGTAATALLAVYDPEGMTSVAAGENSGRRLKEFRIVRAIRPLDPATSEHRITSISATQGAMVVVQTANWQVVGAADLRPV